MKDADIPDDVDGGAEESVDQRSDPIARLESYVERRHRENGQHAVIETTDSTYGNSTEPDDVTQSTEEQFSESTTRRGARDAGGDTKPVTAMDAGGISFAVIKGLIDQNDELAEQVETLTDRTDDLTEELASKDSRIADLEAENKKLRERLTELNWRIARIERALTASTPQED